MKRREIKHPRKIIWIMENFINDIHKLTYTECIMPTQIKEKETIVEFMERLDNAKSFEASAQVKMIYQKEGFAVCLDDKNEKEFRMFYNIESLWSKGNKQFVQDFFSRCPMSRGFASVTITILHEIGHMNAQQDFEGYNRIEAIEELKKNFPRETINFEYFKLPDEKAATDWAIEWLSHSENRRKAKEFEKKFFACFY